MAGALAKYHWLHKTMVEEAARGTGMGRSVKTEAKNWALRLTLVDHVNVEKPQNIIITHSVHPFHMSTLTMTSSQFRLPFLGWKHGLIERE